MSALLPAQVARQPESGATRALTSLPTWTGRPALGGSDGKVLEVCVQRSSDDGEVETDLSKLRAVRSSRGLKGIFDLSPALA